MSTTIALMPLKGHSERVPGKNFRRLAGKPLFRWMLDTLLAVPRIEAVVINTDAADLLHEAGLPDDARVVLRERAPELCGDFVSMNRVLADDVQATDATQYLMTHVTNPLLSASTIERALDRLAAAADKDSLFSVNRVQTRFYREDLSPVNHDPANLLRTQDLEPWFEENSCLYLFGREAFLNADARIGQNPILFETPPLESVDIDEPSDWAMAEALALYAQRGETT